MARGKKFTAAEKHFVGKRIEYEKRIKNLNTRISEQNGVIAKQQEQINALSTENAQLKDWIERLLEYTGLSKEDIKAACEKDNSFTVTASMVGHLFSGIGLVPKKY